MLAMEGIAGFWRKDIFQSCLLSLLKGAHGSRREQGLVELEIDQEDRKEKSLNVYVLILVGGHISVKLTPE